MTLAARPVGARRTDLFCSVGSILTNALMIVVFPVPAYPFNRKQVSVRKVVRNSSKREKASRCCSVGGHTNCWTSRFWICMIKVMQKVGHIDLKSYFCRGTATTQRMKNTSKNFHLHYIPQY